MSRSPMSRRAAVALAVAGLTACSADPPAPASPAATTPTTLSWTDTHLTGSDGSLTWDVVVPRAAGAPIADELNRRVTASAQDVVDAARATVQAGDPPRTLTGQGTVTTDDGRTAQVLLEVVDSTEGTAHPTTTVASTVLDVQRARPLTLDLVFTDPPAAFTQLAPVVEDLAAAQGEPVTTPEGLTPEEANWATWQSGPEGIAFSFQDYQLGGHGVRRYVVPWEQVEPLLTAEARELLAPA
ncbi:hypothetical protein [Kineococcus aurantiacus]|uniref:DUF3298 domain-containing protein n=1 Tax=Kineococcus aurantiacus TaxID=37633 RepID=A0A7Y9DLQ4_9ACTN|nr:hypothetical protein [Kineococcus aurantiacus]NYD22875.1 hypothetical protein [Kineococcus aurantiacus]